MDSKSLSLSTNGLSHIPIKESTIDFKFIVGDATYCCPSWIADFISPKIAVLHSIDNTVMSFRLKHMTAEGVSVRFLDLVAVSLLF
jgi:hypothetical protein